MFYGVKIIDDKDLSTSEAEDVNTGHDLALALLAEEQHFVVTQQRDRVTAYVRRSCATPEILSEARAEARRLLRAAVA